MSESPTELHLLKIHDDGEHLVLRSSEGSEFLLLIDQTLRSSVTKARRLQPARSRAGVGSFGPRDIQARFRQGATVEEIAEGSGWNVERVRRYEWPIVAERAHIINAARSVLVSTADSGRRQGSTALSLNAHIARMAQKYGFSEESADWNTFQQESGSWTITVDFDLPVSVETELPRSVIFPARWTYNPANQSIYASNESAYFLMGRDDSADAPLPGIGQHEASQPETQISEVRQQPSQPLAPALTVEQVDFLQKAENPAEKFSRSGVRNFNSARERKLADLLERARKAAPTASTAPAQSSEENVIPASSEMRRSPAKDISSSHLNEMNASAEPALVQEIKPAENLDQDSSNVTDLDKPRGENKVADRNLAKQESAKPASEQPASAVNPDEANSPKSSRPKRTSVPSWDDIIFGNQRK